MGFRGVSTHNPHEIIDLDDSNTVSLSTIRGVGCGYRKAQEASSWMEAKEELWYVSVTISAASIVDSGEASAVHLTIPAKSAEDRADIHVRIRDTWKEWTESASTRM